VPRTYQIRTQRFALTWYWVVFAGLYPRQEMEHSFSFLLMFSFSVEEKKKQNEDQMLCKGRKC
jgi:hypothetical protein